jgi:glycerol-3-phosphate dehydrogenase
MQKPGWRDAALRRLAEPFDLLIIGGGVNGVGTAWDASLRGLRVLLVERDDLGSGTSSWSSRLIHGGLKYLQKYDVKLVRESLREREWLLQAAPHLVHPLKMVIPIYRGAENGPGILEAGMLAYDALSWDKSMPHHGVWSRRKALERIPGLEAEGLRGAVTYFDAQAELAERLCVETGLAAQAQGAVMLTHAAVETVEVRDQRVAGVIVQDKISGDRYSVDAPVVLNMAGPWVDEVLAGSPAGEGEPLIGGTKGSHFVLDRFDRAPERDALYYESEDGRPMMLMPWQGQVLIGSTDVRFRGDLDRLAPSIDEVDYVLDETNRVVPGARLGREDLLWGYTGVRPLPYSPQGEEGDITRRHSFHDHGPAAEGLISLVGGKLTTFRQVGEEATDLALTKLGGRGRRSVTGRLRLPGAGTRDLERYVRAFISSSGLPEPSARRIAELYGTRADGVAERAATDSSLREVLDEGTGLTAAEVAFAIDEELGVTLTDVLARRTMVGIGPTLADETVDRVTSIAARTAGWTDERAARERDAYTDRLDRFRLPDGAPAGLRPSDRALSA